VTVNPDGSGTVKKHYSLGRLSHELVQVMPDNRTVLMGDDATNSGLFLFVADTEKDLSAGTLYVAKIGEGFSVDPEAAGAKLSWIKLGHAGSDEIEKLADTLKPADIMSVLKADPNDASYTKIFVSGAANWVKLKPGMEKAAAFLETHRYAYLQGGSMGFTKMEGTPSTSRTRSPIRRCRTSSIRWSRAARGGTRRAASRWRSRWSPAA
jgi:secreted PhoX family phosphatase